MIEIVFCTVPSAEIGERLARGLVEQRLAACVNVIPGVRSYFRWEGEVQAEEEVLLKIKTTPARRDTLFQWLEENHPYDVPEILSVPIAGCSSSYAAFVDSETASED